MGELFGGFGGRDGDGVCWYGVADDRPFGRFGCGDGGVCWAAAADTMPSSRSL